MEFISYTTTIFRLLVLTTGFPTAKRRISWRQHDTWNVGIPPQHCTVPLQPRRPRLKSCPQWKTQIWHSRSRIVSHTGI